MDLKKQIRKNKAEIRALERDIEFLKLENKSLELRIELEKYDKSLFEGEEE